MGSANRFFASFTGSHGKPCQLAARVLAVASFSAVVLAGCNEEAPPPQETEHDGQATDALNANEHTAYDFFVAKGLKNFQAAGIVGNLIQESNVDPTVAQYGGGPGRGIAQWSTGGRWDTSANDNAVAYANSKGESVWTLNLQLEFIWYELNTFGYGFSQLKASTDVTGATEAFQDKYEDLRRVRFVAAHLLCACKCSRRGGAIAASAAAHQRLHRFGRRRREGMVGRHDRGQHLAEDRAHVRRRRGDGLRDRLHGRRFTARRRDGVGDRSGPRLRHRDATLLLRQPAASRSRVRDACRRRRARRAEKLAAKPHLRTDAHRTGVASPRDIARRSHGVELRSPCARSVDDDGRSQRTRRRPGLARHARARAHIGWRDLRRRRHDHPPRHQPPVLHSNRGFKASDIR